MKTALVLFAVFFAAVSADTSKWLEFRVKFDPAPTGIGSTSFIPVQKTLALALSNGWVKTEVGNSLGGTVVCWSNLDNRVCPIYDGKGNNAGMMLAIPVTDVEGHGIPYDFNNFGVYEKKVINGVSYWTSTYYLVDPKTVTAGSRPASKTIGDGLWLKSGASSFIQVPTDLASIKNSTKYTWQNCIPGMGIHYYYDVSPSTKCENLEPYFLLVKNDNIVGLGWQFFGKTKYVDKDWYDDIDANAVKATVPLGPTCMPDSTTKYGVISIHTYFVETPWLIPCTQATDSVYPIPGLP